MIGKTLAHYRITAALGAGGMGEVWRATDTKLGREVALKVLPAEMASDPGRLDRFRREAMTLASLNHPNIATLYGLESIDEKGVGEGFIPSRDDERAGINPAPATVHMLVMELVEGEDLSERISRGPIPVDEMMDIAVGLIHALAGAHARGIVHRDLKPANVMVTADGRIKVLDFGLAKITGPQLGEALNSELPTDFRTSDGLVMGTVPYMSPEQVEGRVVDHRTDIFSLGVILYEMAAGRRPFQSESSAGVMSAILRDDPQPLTAIRAGLPDALVQTIARCLAKDTEERPGTVAEVAAGIRAPDSGNLVPTATIRPEGDRTAARRPRLLAALAAVVTAGVAFSMWMLRPAELAPRDAGIAKLAVLPFADLSAGDDQEWIAAGTHEALLTALQQIGGLRVTSRTSSMLYRGTTLPLPEIARELDVGWLVEGSVTRVGDRMRVTAQLVEGSSDQQVWAGQYETDIRDILAQQNEVARKIADEVHVVVTPEEDRRLARAQQVDPAAYRAYINGLHHFDRVTPSEFSRSIQLFEESIALDPVFVPAHAALAAAYGLAVEFGFVSMAEAAPIAERAVSVVQQLDPGSANAYRALANVQFHIRRDFGAAEASYLKADALESNAYALFEYGWLLSQSGRHAEAVAALEEVVALDPRSPLFRGDLGWWSFGARDYDRAIEEAMFALELDPSFPEAHWLLAAAYAEQGRLDDALTEIGLYESMYGGSILWYRGYVLALAGRRAEALQALEDLEANGAPATERAYVLLGLGDREGVLETLEQAESPSVALQPYLWPGYEAFHDEPRFRAVLEKFGLPLPPKGDPE